MSIYVFSVYQMEIGLKIGDFVFLTLILHTFCLFCMMESTYDQPMPFKVHFLVFNCLHNRFSVHLWIYSVSNGKLASKSSILYFWPKFYQHFAVFASMRALMAQLFLSKYIFGIALFAQPFSLSVHGFIVFQMENWPQNWGFCIFDLNFTQIWLFLHV